MTIVYTAPAQGAGVFGERCSKAGVEVICVNGVQEFENYHGADLFIDAAFDGIFADVDAPLLIHSPAKTFSRLPKVPAKTARFCAWPGFWERELWEIATKNGEPFAGEPIVSTLGIKLKLVNDMPGLIAPRVLCTIINEAAFAIHDGVANPSDIDIAMKLGTNYPMGPSEWAKAIGCAEIVNVLTAIGQKHSKYLPHPKLCEAFI